MEKLIKENRKCFIYRNKLTKEYYYLLLITLDLLLLLYKEKLKCEKGVSVYPSYEVVNHIILS